jgi:hypothetical protein
MRRNFVTTMGLALLVSVLMPAEMLIASQVNSTPALTSSHANWYDVEKASNLLNLMQNRAFRVKRQTARLEVQEIELPWQAQAAKLARTKRDVDVIGRDLVRLDRVNGKLEPWQQSLLHKITPELHEMVYQTDAALNTIDAHQNRDYLALTQYPVNIKVLYNNANQMANTIGTVTQYAHAEEKMAELKLNTGRARS